MKRPAFVAILLIALITPVVGFQSAGIKSVEITPETIEAEPGSEISFSAIAKDASGKATGDKPLVWFAHPFDLVTIDSSGKARFYGAGQVRVGVIVGGVTRYVTVTVKPERVASIEISPNQLDFIVGSVSRLNAEARTVNGNPRSGLALRWSSSDQSVAVIDAAGVLTALAPGKAVISAESGGVSASVDIKVVSSPVSKLTIEPRSSRARTGDVLRFKASAVDAKGARIENSPVRWSVSGDGGSIEADGTFIAEKPGSYIINAACGEGGSAASVIVEPRNVERDIEIIGHALTKDVQAAEEWLVGNYAYVSTISDRLLVWDISDPSKPRLTDTLKVDARHVNDISTTADGRIGVLTREGASNRKNGIVFLDTSDPAHPTVISEYTATVTGGVHSAFVDSHYVYLTDDATGSLRVIDFKDVKNPKEIARWEVMNPLARPARDTTGGESTGGRYLHDVQVKDGLAYLAYWRDGLIILDVGKGLKGGSPENPQLVSQYRFNYHELYGDGWLCGAHAVFRYKNYVFVGDEVFPDQFDIQSRARIPARGVVHVIDVSDIMHPRKVAEYGVPEGGSHNMWVEGDVLYMGYYTGGGRILDVSGELRGDLYRQGREIGRLWTGDPQGYRPNVPFTWGAQPYKGLVYFNDVNSGLWIVKIGKAKYKGSTTVPGY